MSFGSDPSLVNPLSETGPWLQDASDPSLTLTLSCTVSTHNSQFYKDDFCVASFFVFLFSIGLKLGGTEFCLLRACLCVCASGLQLQRLPPPSTLQEIQVELKSWIKRAGGGAGSHSWFCFFVLLSSAFFNR